MSAPFEDTYYLNVPFSILSSLPIKNCFDFRKYNTTQLNSISIKCTLRFLIYITKYDYMKCLLFFHQVENTFTWTPQKEVKLFETILSYKPAGLVKHFNMALIHYKLVQQGLFELFFILHLEFLKLTLLIFQ